VADSNPAAEYEETLAKARGFLAAIWSRRRFGFPLPIRFRRSRPRAKFCTSWRAPRPEKGADEALLLNTNGEAAETASGNLFWISTTNHLHRADGRGILPGITRAVVLEICQTLGLETNKRVIKPEALRNSNGHFRHAKRAGHRAGGGV
jgi:hypothetical protein